MTTPDPLAEAIDGLRKLRDGAERQAASFRDQAREAQQELQRLRADQSDAEARVKSCNAALVALGADPAAEA